MRIKHRITNSFNTLQNSTRIIIITCMPHLLEIILKLRRIIFTEAYLYNACVLKLLTEIYSLAKITKCT